MAKLLLWEQDGEKSWQQPFLEVNVFGLTGRADQSFVIGSGSNFQANHNYWIELIYGVRNTPIFYSRNFIHYHVEDPIAARATSLKDFLDGTSDHLSIADLLPETCIAVKRKRFAYEGETHNAYTLSIALDVGAVFEWLAPGERFIEFQDNVNYDPEDLFRFIRELFAEFDLADAGKRPDPAAKTYYEWPFALQINRRAYDTASEGYQENYFANERIRNMFDVWQYKIAPGGHVLDIGCGHGSPVINRLLERGHTVTGIDLSPKMLAKARSAFPCVTFHNQTINQLEEKGVYDAACSFNSMLYLDPIDFYHGIYTLHRALKPGGRVLLFGYDSSPHWSGAPLNEFGNQLVWQWKYGMDEAAAALEEHSRFRVIKTADTTTGRERRTYIARYFKEQREMGRDLARIRKQSPPDHTAFHLPKFADLEPPIAKQLPYNYVIIAEKIG